MNLEILYFGDDSPAATSRHRADALRRLGHRVMHVDIRKSIGLNNSSRLANAFHYRTGYRFVQHRVTSLLSTIDLSNVDLIWVDGGEFFTRDSLQQVKGSKRPAVLYNADDITGARDGRRFEMVRKSIPAYDLCTVVRDVNVEEFKRLEAQRVLRIWRSYDELAHCPSLIHDVPNEYQSQVAFIGTRIPGENRDQFLLELVRRGVNVSIWGDKWKQSPLWRGLESHYRGPNLFGRDYVHAIRGSKLCLGLLSRGNRDLDTSRSAEIPFAGGLLCAERTEVHTSMYREGEEAVFWSDVDECVRVCKELLADAHRRERIRRAGMQRVRERRVGNEDVCRQILEYIGLCS